MYGVYFIANKAFGKNKNLSDSKKKAACTRADQNSAGNIM